MPRPMRMRSLEAPGLSLISLSFIALPSLRFNADKMLDLRDHATHGRRIIESRLAADLVQSKTDERRALCCRAADRAAGLHDGNLAFALLAVLRHPPLHRLRRLGGETARSRLSSCGAPRQRAANLLSPARRMWRGSCCRDSTSLATSPRRHACRASRTRRASDRRR